MSARPSGPTAPEHLAKPWGHETIRARTDRYVGKILHVRAGEALSLQYHRVKEETIRVLEVSTTELDDVVRVEDRYRRVK